MGSGDVRKLYRVSILTFERLVSVFPFAFGCFWPYRILELRNQDWGILGFFAVQCMDVKSLSR